VNNNKKLSISDNKKVLAEYETFRIRELPDHFLSNKIEKVLVRKKKSKRIYKCLENGEEKYYEVFINFLDKVPLKFWVFSLYDYQEIYPDEKEFNDKYRAWRFDNEQKALDKYRSLE